MSPTIFFRRKLPSLLGPGRLLSILRTLVIALAGASIAAFLGLPAAWLSGAMIAVTIASLAGLDTRMPPRLFDVTMVLIGIILGAGVSPALLSRISAWPVSLACLLVSIAAIQFAVQTFFVRVGGWDRATAFFASLPGALSYVLATAAETKADMGKVIVGQSIRLFLLVAALPSIVVTAGHAPTAASTTIAATPRDLLLLVVAGAATGILFRAIRFPGALLAGSFAASAILHGGGWIEGSLPYPAMIGSFVVLGAFVGSRFSGTDVWLLRQIVGVSLGAFLVAITVAAGFAAAVSALAGLPFAQVLMAFAPGGMDSMTAVAIALHMDSAYVAVHQLLRFVLIAFTAPIVAALSFRRKPE